MILVNNGMAKSGSTLLLHYCLELLDHAYPVNGEDAFRRAVATGQLAGFHEYMDAPTEQSLPILEGIAKTNGPIVVKTHTDTNDFLPAAIRQGRIVMVTTFRDPRDMLLSAIDHSRRVRNDPDPVFQEFTNIEQSIPHARWWAKMAIHWIKSGLTLAVRYEDLLRSPESVLSRVATHWGIQSNTHSVNEIVARETQIREYGKNQFNRGKVSRWNEELRDDEISMLNEGLKEEILALGYPLTRDEMARHGPDWSSQ